MRQTRAPILLISLLLSAAFCPLARARTVLTVSFFDVGQGDSIYIEAPNGTQMIIDGGSSGSLLAPLERVMPFGDRTVNVIMTTNPDSDHYAGFLDLLKTYSVGAVIEPGTVTKTSTHADFQAEIAHKKIPELLARRGMIITLDKESGVTFTVLFPDRDVSALPTNDGSIVGVLQYGSTRIMFTGDATKKQRR